MAKLTKRQVADHNTSLRILDKDIITDDEREFVFRHYHPGAIHMNGATGAFFAPPGLSRDFTINTNGASRVLDLCAGIGALSIFKFWHSQWSREDRDRLQITCVEINPDYCAAGRKLLPEAAWINEDIFSLSPTDLGEFDIVIGNSPFGPVKRSGSGPRYTGPHFEFHVIDFAAAFAPYGVFIVPTASAPFVYSGASEYRDLKSGRGVDFQTQTGIRLSIGCSVDCATYKNEWFDVAPDVEIVCADYTCAKPVAVASRQLELMDSVA